MPTLLTCSPGFAYQLLRLAQASTVSWILGAFIMFHYHLNILAELIRFGNREFYKDWWNCKSLGEYWRLWNLPVHHFFLRHVTNPLVALGVNKNVVNSVVFLISALAHEYIASIMIGKVKTLVLVSFCLQYPFILVEDVIQRVFRLQDSYVGNFMFWLNMCILGQPLLIVIYYISYIE